MSSSITSSVEQITYDISIIRPELKNGDIKIRGRDFSPQRQRAIKKALLTLHKLETMAANIYRYQIDKSDSELNRSLIAAMCNEMTHIQDFQVKLFEYGFKPCRFQSVFGIVGSVIGLASRLLGKKTILKTGIWVETKAVHHYGELLRAVEFDEETKMAVEKDMADEQGHINHWRELLSQE